MHHRQHHHSPDQNFIKKIAFLDSKQRETLVPFEALVDQIPIQKEHTLLDVGAGSGFFTIPMAESTSGTVYALDPDPRMLSVIEEKAKKKGLQNITLLQTSIEDLSLQTDSIDFAMASLLLHEVSSIPRALTKIYEVLKTGGHLLCLEYEKDEKIIEGPPITIRIWSNELERTLTSLGFRVIQKNKISDALYTVLATKVGKNK